jgi:hypothetical protein
MPLAVEIPAPVMHTAPPDRRNAASLCASSRPIAVASAGGTNDAGTATCGGRSDARGVAARDLESRRRSPPEPPTVARRLRQSWAATPASATCAAALHPAAAGARESARRVASLSMFALPFICRSPRRSPVGSLPSPAPSPSIFALDQVGGSGDVCEGGEDKCAGRRASLGGAGVQTQGSVSVAHFDPHSLALVRSLARSLSGSLPFSAFLL